MGKGSIIGKVNNPTSIIASGVWDVREQFIARSNNMWPKSINEFESIADYFSGQNFSLYDFRPGLNSIFSDTALTAPITTGGVAIAGVKDLGTNGRHLTQITSGNRPISVLNGPAIFNGSTNLLDTTTSVFGIRSCIVVTKLNTGTATYTGVVTNQTDQGTNVDFAFTRNFTNPYWDASQGAGLGLADSTHFWQNKSTQTITITFDALCCYSIDGTGFPSTLNFPNGMRVGLDRNNAGRYLNGTIGALFIHSDSILSTTDRNYVEDQFNSVFSLY
jgi:hypothetical protein